MEKVFPDSNVLYPISVANLTLRLGDLKIHEVLWSEDLLGEVERVLVDRKGLTLDQARYFCDCIRDAFPEGEVSRADYGHLVGSRTGSDVDDRVHSAAAVGCGATILLTSNTRHFPKRDLGNVRRATPDEYFMEVLDAYPDEVLTLLHEMGSERRHPESIAQTLAALERAGLKQFARQVGQHLGKAE